MWRNTFEADESGTLLLTRRSWLKSTGITIGTIASFESRPATAATTDGDEYGYGGHGEGGYGGSSTDTDVTVSTDDATNVGETGATLQATLTDLGGASSADVYFEFREVNASTWTTTSVDTLTTTGTFSESITGLVDGVDYEFRAVSAASDGDTDTGTIAGFTTVEHAVTVSTDGATDIGETGATLNGTLTDLGNAASAKGYFEYREVGSSSWNATFTHSLSSTGTFSETISGLTDGTDYEFRAVASASDGDTDVGSSLTYTTVAADSAPTVGRFDVSEAGSPNPHAEISAGWAVSDVDGDLATVSVTAVDASGRTVKSAETTVDGTSASGSDSFQIKHGGGQDYEVTILVRDAGGNSSSQTATVSS